MRRKQEEPVSSDRWLIPYAGFVTLVMAFFVIMYATSQKKLKNPEVNPEPKAAAMSSDPSAAEFQMAFESQVREVLPADSAVSDTLQFEPSHVLSKGLQVRVLAPRLFLPGQSEVSPEFRPLLDRIGVVIQKSGKSVQITGHADAEDSAWIVAHADSRHRNTWELSAARAAWLAQYWMKRLSWSPARLSVAAYSRYRPLAESVAGIQAPGTQRRIEILVMD